MWPGTRVFRSRMIKSIIERLPTVHTKVRTVARGVDGGNDKQGSPPTKAQEQWMPVGIEGCGGESHC